MRFLSSYFHQGISHGLKRDTERGLSFFVDCRAVMNNVPLFYSAREGGANNVRGESQRGEYEERI